MGLLSFASVQVRVNTKNDRKPQETDRRAILNPKMTHVKGPDVNAASIVRRFYVGHRSYQTTVNQVHVFEKRENMSAVAIEI